jgi:methyltransferase (TIGR00027 family)
MDNEVAVTARHTAAIRARETGRADGLFQDPWAAALAGDEALAALSALPAQVVETACAYTAIRTRVFDDWLRTATGADDAPRQVVLLGAGLDTRAFRLNWRQGVQVWEVDQAQLLEAKEATLVRAAATPGCVRRSVATDFADEDWPSALTSANFRPDLPTVWLAEGLLAYLVPETAEHLLTRVAKLSAVGSQLVADLVARDFISARNAYSASLNQAGARQNDVRFHFGTNDPEQLLAGHGWRAEMVKQPGEEGANFGRWSLPSAAHDGRGSPQFFFVCARLAAE